MKEARRLINAFGYSLDGLRVAWLHPAFRIELIVACVMLPLAVLLSQAGAERAMLIGSVMLVLIVELLNTAVEEAINRIGTEWHEKSKIAKDMGSAAVLLSIINAGLVWLVVIGAKL